MPEYSDIIRRTAVAASLTAVALTLPACTNHFGPFYVPSGYAHHGGEYKAPPGSELVTIPDEEMETGETYTTDDGFFADDGDYGEVAEDGYDDYKPEEEYETVTMVTLPEEKHEELYGVDISSQAGPKPVALYGEEAARNVPPPIATGISAPAGTYVPDYSTPSLSGGDFASAADDLLAKMTRDFGRPAEPVYLKAENSYDSRNAGFESSLKKAMRAQGYTIASVQGEGPFTMTYNISDMGGVANHVMASISLWSGATQLAGKSGTYAVTSGQYTADSTVTAEAPVYTPPPVVSAPDAPAKTGTTGGRYPSVSYKDGGVSYPVEDDVTASEPVSLFEP